MLSRRRAIAAKIEAVEGTMENITVADSGVLAVEPKFDADIKMYDRNVMLGTLSNLQPIPGAQGGSVSFKVELKGTEGAYASDNLPDVSTFIRACGFAETLDVTTPGSETITYLPASTGIPSLTIWLYEDGMVRKLYGCRGTVSFSGKIGEPVFADFKFTGVYGGTATAAMITPTFADVTPPTLLGANLAIDAYAAICESFSIDMGNEIQLRSSISAAKGYLSALMTGRKPTGKLDPEMVLPATYDFMGKWTSGTTAALSIGPIGGTDYNKFNITAPKCAYTQVGSGDRSGNMTADLSFALAMVTGDDEFKLEFVK